MRGQAAQVGSRPQRRLLDASPQPPTLRLQAQLAPRPAPLARPRIPPPCAAPAAPPLRLAGAPPPPPGSGKRWPHSALRHPPQTLQTPAEGGGVEAEAWAGVTDRGQRLQLLRSGAGPKPCRQAAQRQRRAAEPIAPCPIALPPPAAAPSPPSQIQARSLAPGAGLLPHLEDRVRPALLCRHLQQLLQLV